jgi:hypothetical protein
MLFYQSAAPTGWTQLTTQNNKALRVVSGTGGGTGGSNTFTTTFAAARSVPLLQHKHNANLSNQTANHSHGANASSNTNNTGNHAHGVSDPGHNHGYQRAAGSKERGNDSSDARAEQFQTVETQNSGTGISIQGNGSHSHNVSTNVSVGNNSANHKHNISIANNGQSGASMDFAVSYIDVIICSKD